MRFLPPRLRRGAAVLTLAVVPLGAGLAPAAPASAATPSASSLLTVKPHVERDPWLRPFISTSIWNMPIGSRAQYVDAGFPRAAHVRLDANILMRTSATDPARAITLPGSWRERCSGTVQTRTTVNLPDGWVLPDAVQRPDGGWDTPNNVGAILMPDGRTLQNVNGMARCEKGGGFFSYRTGKPHIDTTDLYGDGRFGSHGASRLSGIGGSVRPGELSGTAPVQHALDLVLWAKHLHWGGSRAASFRWPAADVDAYASSSTYTGRVPATKMGALLALPPSTTAAQLGVDTAVGRKLFAALRDYGAYVTDDAAWDAHYLSVDSAAIGTFSWGAAEQAEFNRMVDALHVVNNNTSSSIGGGGVPRRPLLPELVPPLPLT